MNSFLSNERDTARERAEGFLPPPRDGANMSDFDGLDLQSVEDQLDDDELPGGSSRVVLGVLDGTTPPYEWIDIVESGAVLVLNVEGDLNELAAGFARDVKEGGGQLMHFRDFLIVTPPGVDIDADRLE
jgi:hypothetical protein